EEVAGAADLEVAESDLETLPELVQAGDHIQPLIRRFRERPARVVKEVRIRTPARTPDSASQLVQLGEAEAIGLLDDDGVDVRDVQSRLDDGRAHEDVELG